jgi:SAM-dependent methyltransferase
MIQVLEPDEIVGHVRFELGPQGDVFFPDFNGPYHWKPGSVKPRGRHLFAEFTNEHSGLYMLTQGQLRRAIASGGYLQSPYQGRHGMLETAATDPFTRCGFRKVLCISEPDDFLVHHMSNRYAGEIGITLDAFKRQLNVLANVGRGTLPAATLCEVEPKVLQRRWSKGYYEEAHEEVLSLVPTNARTLLSVGCGSGDTEIELVKRGIKVTALPLDSVIGGVVAEHGIEVVNGSLHEGLEALNGRKFQCVVIVNLLHLQADPWRMLRDCARFVDSDGAIVVSGYNFDLPTNWLRRLRRVEAYRKLNDFNQSGIQIHRPREVLRQLEAAGFSRQALRWFDPVRPQHLPAAQLLLGRLTSWKWAVRACPNGSRPAH